MRYGNVHYIHRRFVRELLTSLDGSVGTIDTANAIFGHVGLQFLPTYLNKTKQYYYTSLQQMNFKINPEKSRQVVNQWVSNRTHGHIKNLMPPGSIGRHSLLVVVNAVFFKGLWEIPFHAHNTTMMDFHVTRSQSTKVDMMCLKAYLGFASDIDGKYDVLELPYEGNTAFYIILPHKNVSLYTVENMLNMSKLNDLMDNLNTALRVEAWVPKFEFTQRFNLVDVLKNLGVRDVFDPVKCDLSNMTGQGDHEKVMLSGVYHKTAIELNEEGTIATGGTGSIYIPISEDSPFEDVQFRADRPFLFLIRDKLTRSILFLGRFTSPPNTDIGTSPTEDDKKEEGGDAEEDEDDESVYVFEPIERETVNPLGAAGKNPPPAPTSTVDRSRSDASVRTVPHTTTNVTSPTAVTRNNVEGKTNNANEMTDRTMNMTIDPAIIGALHSGSVSLGLSCVLSNLYMMTVPLYFTMEYYKYHKY